MSTPATPALAQLISAIDAEWQGLRSFLAAVTTEQEQAKDHAGWSVKDHVTHLAVWMDSVTALFRGGRRHAGLGIDESIYAAGDFDQINLAIQERFAAVSLAQAIQQLEEAHARLVTSLQGLSEADLKVAVRSYFPQAPATDDRPLSALIWDNSGGHFNDHLKWMRELIK